MELRQLEYLVAVADEGSFTRAAERLHVAQPGVSAQVRRLERELGQELLDRSGRRVRPTAVGAAVLPYARGALEAVAGARVAVDELAGLARGRVAVGMLVSCGIPDLPALLDGFHRAHPGVEITLTEADSDRLLAALREGTLDMAVIGVAGDPPAGVESQVIVDEPLVAAVARGHPLAGRASLPLASLRGQALVSLCRGTGVRASLDAGCAAAGVSPRIAFEASDPDVLARLAERGLGVAILPASVAAAHAAGLHAIALIRPRLRSRIELAWRSAGPIGPAARALIAHARTVLAEGRP